jgi:hypothetical protein
MWISVQEAKRVYGEPIFNHADSQADAVTLQAALEAVVPYVGISVSTLGGMDRFAFMIRLSLDPKTDWINGIFQNSRFMHFSLAADGVLDQFGMSHKIKNKKFRKTTVSSISQAASKLASYLKSSLGSVKESRLMEKDVGRKSLAKSLGFRPPFGVFERSVLAEDATAASKRKRREVAEGLSGPIAPTAKNLSYVLEPDKAKELAKILKMARGHNAVDQALDKANEMLGGHGVEAINYADHHVDNYYFDIALLYVNMGDTYDQTVMYDTSREKFFTGTYGDWVAYTERKGLEVR